MKMPQLQHIRSWKKRRLPLRLRLALWAGALVLVLSFGLLLFINSVAFSSFHRIIRDKIPPPVAIQPLVFPSYHLSVSLQGRRIHSSLPSFSN